MNLLALAYACLQAGSAALGFELTDKWGAFAEVFAFNRTSPDGRGQSYVDGGFTYGLTPDLQLDARGLWPG